MTATMTARDSLTDSIILQTADGARAVIALYGAHVLSWQPAGQAEAIFLSPSSDFTKSAAIRGGVPIIFPQFSTRGSGQRHGFARNLVWRCVDTQAELARFALASGDVQTPSWPHAFELIYEVKLAGAALHLSLQITNTDTQAWSFNAALHTYLHVNQLSALRIEGLQGLDFIEHAHPAGAGRQHAAALSIDGEVDRIYAGVVGPLTLHDAGRSMEIRQLGFTDAVIWNPGAEKAAATRDLGAGSEQHFVCIEAGSILQPIILAPGAQWTGSQILQQRSSPVLP